MYRRRLQALGMQGLRDVLDAGSGFAQWSFPLARLNHRVVGLELEAERVRTSNALKQELSTANVEFREGSIEELPFPDASFDAVFCYGVVFLADWRKSFREIRRVLRPGALFYFSADDLGYFVFNILERPNPTSDHDPRVWAVEALEHSLDYYANGVHRPGTALVVPKAVATRELESLGFELLAEGGDGSIEQVPGFDPTSFFPAEHYGKPGVYEMLCRRGLAEVRS